MKKTGIVIAGALVALSLTGCSVAANSDETYVHKGGGIVEAAVDKGCIKPAERELQRPGDAYFAYPANQRVYDFTGSKTSDGGAFSVVSKDGQTLVVPGTLTFSLNPDCKTLQAFHDRVGNRYVAYEAEGWNKMLNIHFRPALDATLDRVAKQYTWAELYSDPTIKDELNKAVNQNVKTLINQQFDGDFEYFIGYSALIQQPQAAKELVDAAKKNEVSKAEAAATKTKAEADAAAAQAAANAQVSQKQAELKVAQIQNQIEAAKIAPFGSAREYNNYLAIQKGLNPYQPVYGAGVLVDSTK